jgi:hypothetical protein
VIGRACVAVLAVVVLAWLTVMERDVRLQSEARQSSRANLAAKADRQLRRSKLLNPDPGPDLTRALIAIGQDQRRRAIRVVEDVVRREPDNITAWSQLLFVARGHDPAAVRRALLAVRRLDPLSAPRE